MLYSSLPVSPSDHQVRFDHIPNRPVGPVSVMALGSLPVVPIGPLHMVCSARTILIVQEGYGALELVPSQAAEGLS